MLNVGFSELLLFGIIALIVLGPEKLPVAARTAGRWYAHLRRLATNLQHDIEKELQLAELREHMQQELARIKDIEKQMQAQLDEMHQELAELNPNTIATPVVSVQPIYRFIVPDNNPLATQPVLTYFYQVPYTLSYQYQFINIVLKNPLSHAPIAETSA